MMRQTLMARLTIDKAAALHEWFGEHFLADRRRKSLACTDFTIISNNCWGGHVYRHYGLPYASPTVGLYFFAEEYIRLLSDLRKHLFSPLRVIKANESRYAAYLHSKKQDEVPIGVLGDEVEIVFLHYKTAEEVIEKWNRRLSRVNMNKIYVKFSEQNLCEKRHIDAFHAMAFPHKVLLLSEPYANAPEGIVVERYAEPGNVINDARYYADFFDLTDWLNGKEFELL